MSVTFPRGISKGDLQAIYSEIGVAGDVATKKVAELKADIESNIQSNKNALVARANNSENLTYILDRLAPSAKSPTKRQAAAEKLQESVTSEDEPAPKKGRRKTVAPAEESTSNITDLIKTPAKDLGDAIAPRRSSILASPGNLDTSPRAVADYLERNTRKISGYVSDGIERTHLTEYRDLLRSYLSAPLAINGLALGIELGYLFFALVEMRHAFGLPVPYFGKIVAIRSPDLFALITPDFWAPFSLFVLTTIIAPTLVAFFINYPLRSATTHGHATRRASAQQDAAPNVDPFVFNIAKALIAYLVFAVPHPLGISPYSRTTINTVHAGLPFGASGLITSSVIGATVALYEAVLKK